jgi:hypothetical protein
MEPEDSVRHSQATATSPKSEALRKVLWDRKFLRWEIICTSPNPQVGGQPLVGSRLFIKYIRSYPPYLEAETGGRAKSW